jgi:hypothetical protein
MTHWQRGLRGGVASGGRGELRGSLGKEGEGPERGSPRQPEAAPEGERRRRRDGGEAPLHEHQQDAQKGVRGLTETRSQGKGGGRR